MENLLKKASDAIMDMDEDATKEVLDEAIASNFDLKQLLEKGLSVGMTELGEQFSAGEVFLPELLTAAEIMQNATKRIETELAKSGISATKKGKVVFATVNGDIHDIGKGICCSLLKTGGINVIDLGRDVPAETIVDKAVETDADIIAMSSLLTTSMHVQQDVCKILEERGIRDKFYVMVGGAPVTQRWCDKIKANAYTENATECSKVVSDYIASIS